jgi:hypothetical protein
MASRAVVFRTILIGALLAGGAAAGVAGVSFLARTQNGGRFGLLVAGLALGAGALTAAGFSVGLALRSRQSGDRDSAQALHRRRRILFSLLILIAQTGLAWLLIQAASRHHSGAIWLTGLLALATTGLAILTWITGGTDFDKEILVIGLPIVLAQASLGVLTAGFSAEHHLTFAWLLAGLAIAESAGWMVLPSADNDSADALTWALFASIYIVPAASAIGLLVKFSLDGNALAASLTGVAGLVVLLLVLLVFDAVSIPHFDWDFYSGHASPGTTIPAFARVGALVIPIGTIVWAEVSRVHGPATPVQWLSAVALVILASIGLLILQGLAIVWLRPMTAWSVIASAAQDARGRGELPYEAFPDRGQEFVPEASRYGPSARERYEAERYERERRDQDRYASGPYERERRARERYLRDRDDEQERPLRDRYEERERYARELYERERYERDRRDQERRDQERYEQMRRIRGSLGTRLIRGVIQPVSLTPDTLQSGVDLALSTGLEVDLTWPRLQLVVPPDVRRDVARKERAVAVLRMAAGSAICTALAWPLSAAVILSGASGAELAASILAPLAVAIAMIVVARSRLADVYLRRVHTTELYRFDLLKALHLPRPRNDAQFAAVSRYVDYTAGNRPVVWDENTAPTPEIDLTQLRETLAPEVARLAEERIDSLLQRQRDLLLRDGTELLERQREQFRNWLAEQALGPEELDRLAVHIAERAAGPVSADLGRQVAQIQEQFSRRLRSTLEEVVGESVLGPSLTNFTGYMTLELHRSSEEDPKVGSSGGTVRTGPGHELGLVMSVARNQSAARVAPLSQGPDGSFLVLEPFIIEGGRDAAVAQFDAVADCATLTPLPRRRSLDVADQASIPFRFKLPNSRGQHELWFQLYQAGRLVQAVAVSVEVGPEQVMVK